MRKILNKELKLSASPLSFWFIAFALMTMLPGYPILMGAFFISFGIFQSFVACREANDMLYSSLLPVKKTDFVKGKYVFACFIELCGFLVMTLLTLVRMLFLSEAAVYRSNALMTANFVFLGFALLIFGIFNAVFIRGFFKTAYYFTKPLIGFIVCTMLVIGLAETLHHLPGAEVLNSFGFENAGLQCAFFGTGFVCFVLLTLYGYKKSALSFEKTDIG